MPKYPLTERQKVLLRTLPEALESGKVEARWVTMYVIGAKAMEIFGINDREISMLWLDAKDSDLDQFEKCGFMQCVGYDGSRKSVWSLDEYTIAEAVKNDFEMPGYLTGGQHIHIGDVSGSNININSSLEKSSQVVQHSSSLDEEFKTSFDELMQSLREALVTAPSEEAEAVAEQANILAQQVSKDSPNRTSIKITADGLKAAADTVSKVAPAVFVTAIKIVDLLIKSQLISSNP